MTTQTPWYRTGTVAVTAGSKSVTGAGSAWQSQVLAGDLFGLTDANGNLTTALAEVESVSSDTALTLKSQWPGSTLSGQKYAIIRNFTGSLPADLAARLSKLIAQYQISVDELTDLLTSSGTVTLTTLTGETVSVQGMAGITTRLTAVESALAAKLDDSQATAAGLALLGAADVAAQRSTLGLANHEKLSVSVDSVNGQVVLVGGSSGNITLGQFANGAWLGNSGVGAAGPFRFGVASGEAFRISELRNVLVGITTDNGSDMLQVGGNGSFNNLAAQGYADTDSTVVAVRSNRNNASKPRADLFAFGSSSSVNYMGQKASTAGLYTAYADMVLTVDTGNSLRLCTGGSERVTVDSSGNLIQTVNSTAATLSTNGTMTASIVNDTSLKFSVRGSDGVTRSATVALA